MVRSMSPRGTLGPPTQLNKLWWGEAEARIAYMAPSAIRCDRVADGEWR